MLVLKTVGLREVLAERLSKADVTVAFVFGSIARGEERSRSDVDLMVIGNVGLREVSRLLAGVDELIYREVNAHVFNLDECKRRIDSGEHFLNSVLKSAKLFIIGDENDLGAMGD